MKLTLVSARIEVNTPTLLLPGTACWNILCWIMYFYSTTYALSPLSKTSEKSKKSIRFQFDCNMFCWGQYDTESGHDLSISIAARHA